MLKHYICFLYFCFPLGEISRELKERKFQPCDLPQNAIGYFFFDQFENSLTTSKKMLNLSDRIYIGKEYPLEEIKENFREEKKLISLMERLHKKRAVLLKNNNWHLIGEFDTVIET